MTTQLLLGWLTMAAATSGKLAHVAGPVWLVPDGKPAVVAKGGDSLGAGTRLRVGADGTADVILVDGSSLQVRSGTEIVLSATPRQTKKSTVLLFFGTLWSRVTKGDAQAYEVSTANAVCGVRGTEFITTVADDGAMRVSVTDGKVHVAGDAGKVDVSAGGAVAADQSAVGPLGDANDLAAWSKERHDGLPGRASGIMKGLKARVETRHGRLSALRGEQKKASSELSVAIKRGDALAAKASSKRIAELADAIADLADEVASVVGVADHIADLAADPRFAAIDRKTLGAQAKNLRRVKATLDKLVSEGTDVSIDAMEGMMRQMRQGRDTLRDEPGSTADELLDNDDEEDF